MVCSCQLQTICCLKQNNTGYHSFTCNKQNHNCRCRYNFEKKGLVMYVMYKIALELPFMSAIFPIGGQVWSSVVLGDGSTVVMVKGLGVVQSRPWHMIHMCPFLAILLIARTRASQHVCLSEYGGFIPYTILYILLYIYIYIYLLIGWLAA